MKNGIEAFPSRIAAFIIKRAHATARIPRRGSICTPDVIDLPCFGPRWNPSLRLK